MSANTSQHVAGYIELGLVPIPISPGGKNPLVKWDRYQDEAPQAAQVTEWFTKNPSANIGLVTGPVSGGLIVLDIDDPHIYLQLEAIEKWQERTRVVRTGGGGYHVWLKSESPCDSFTLPNPRIEVKGYGSQVVAPPSIHSSGQLYEFVNPNANTIMSVKDAEQYVYDLAEKAGVKYASESTYQAVVPRATMQDGADPAPVQQMLQGVKEGERNKVAFELASYFMFHRGLKKEDCEHRLIGWNKRNQPPLSDEEVEAVVRSVAKHGYRVGTRRIHLRCPAGGCPECRDVPRPEDYHEADQRLKDPALLYRSNEILGKRIEGEEKNRALVLLLGLSGKLSQEHKAIVAVKGDSAGGKSNLAKILTQIYKVKEVGRFSPTALEYGKIGQYEILLIKELYEEDKTRIRLLSSSDGGYIASVTEHDPSSKKFRTSEYQIPPITLFTTTTRIDLDPQFSNRAWEINVDESPELTQRIYGFKERKEDERIKRILIGSPPDSSMRLLRAIVERLQPQEVIVPYAEAFRALLDPRDLRSRRDWDKICDLVHYSAFLYQYQRPRINDTIVATLQDLYYALAVGLKSFQRTKKGIEKRIEEATQTILGFQKDFTRKELAEKLGKSDTYVKGIVKVLKEKAILQVTRYEGRLEHLEVADRQSLSSLSSKSSLDTMTKEILQNALSHLQKRASSHPAFVDTLKPEYFVASDPISGQRIELDPSALKQCDDKSSVGEKAANHNAVVVPAPNAHDDVATKPPQVNPETLHHTDHEPNSDSRAEQ